MSLIEQAGRECGRCSLLRRAHELQPLKAINWVWSEMMGKMAVCLDCGHEALAMGLSVELIRQQFTSTGGDDARDEA